MSALRSLRARLIAAVLGTTAVVVAMAGATAWLASARARGLGFDEELREQARQLRPRLEATAWRHLRDPGAEAEDLPAAGPDGALAALLGDDGRVLAGSAGAALDGATLAAAPFARGAPADGVVRDGAVAGLGAVRWMAQAIAAHPPPGQERPPRPGEDRRARPFADQPQPPREGGRAFAGQPPPPDDPPRFAGQPPRDGPPRFAGPPREDEPLRQPGDRPAPPAGRPPEREARPLARLVLVRPTRALRAELAGQAWLLAGMGALACALAAVVVALVISRLLRPLRRLGDDIAGVVPGESAALAVAGLPGELLPVQERLNQLLVRVVEVLERERRTTANIAHELRTPLAGLRAKLELALLREREPEQIAGLCRQGLATMTQLQALVDNLLLLARLEAGQVAPHREAVEVADAVAVAWSLHQPAAEARGLRLERAIEPALALATDAGKLRAILGNLLSNAVAYADQGSAIRLAAAEIAGGVRIEVANEGATIVPADAERVFEPFWRGDAARTVESGHCGLGLPLVRRLAAILGGTVAVAIDGRTFRVSLVLPDGQRKAIDQEGRRDGGPQDRLDGI